MMTAYEISFFDAAGCKIASGPSEAQGDVRAVVAAIKLLDERPECEAVEVSRAGRVLRRVARSDLRAGRPA